MKKIVPYKYEKIDEHTIRVTANKIDDIDMTVLIKNKEIMEDRVAGKNAELNIEKERLEQIDKLIAEAEKLGIKPKENKKA